MPVAPLHKSMMLMEGVLNRNKPNERDGKLVLQFATDLLRVLMGRQPKYFDADHLGSILVEWTRREQE